MGLAAPQARILMLTARKSDVGFNEMKIANQKISLSRESAEASKVYSDALNARKLTWSVDGTTTGDNTVDLTYNLLMRPNSTADSGQYIYTNTSNGKVILDSQYASIVGKDSGNSGDLAKSMTQAAFLAKLMNLSESDVSGYVNNGNTNATGTFTTSYNDSEIIAAAGLTKEYGKKVALNSNKNNNTGHSNPTSADISEAAEAFEANCDNITSGLGSALTDSILGKIGSGYSDKIEAAIKSAATATENKFLYGTNDGSTGTSLLANKVGGFDDTGKACAGQNQVTWIYGSHGSSNIFGGSCQDGEYYVDNSQIIKTFLTFFDQACASFLPEGATSANQSTVGASTTTRTGTGGTGTTTGPSDTNSTSGTDANKNDIGDAYEASFYLNLYSALNSFGWQTNDDVQSKKYLQAQILFGNAEIKQLQGDGSWKSVSSSDADSPLRNESDDAGIAKAEAEYNTKKLQIETKEQQLDLDMKNLDTELAAINVDIDSVKAILKTSIEKDFKMFQA